MCKIHENLMNDLEVIQKALATHVAAAQLNRNGFTKKPQKTNTKRHFMVMKIREFSFNICDSIRPNETYTIRPL